MTEEQLFFTKLHGKLAKTLKITSTQVNSIRSMVLGQDKSIDEVAEWLEVKIQQPKRQGGKESSAQAKKHTGRRSMPRQYYQQMLDFINSVKQAEWDLLIQKTEYDLLSPHPKKEIGSDINVLTKEKEEDNG